MLALIRKSELNGKIKAPPSKSFSHRAIICAALARGRSKIKHLLKSDDVDATVSACESFGVQIRRSADAIIVEGTAGELRAPEKPINCQFSGSTLRFVIPLAALAKGRTVITGEGRLLERPIGPLIEAMRMLGVECESKNGFPPAILHGDGSIRGGTATIRGDVSSQFISGLLMVAPRARAKTKIILTSKLESRPYVDITLEVMNSFGISVLLSTDYGEFEVDAPQDYNGINYEIEGDFSSSAFLLCAAAVAGEVTISSLNPNSVQGDSAVVSILKEMGADIKTGDGFVSSKKSELKGTEIDASNIPDLVPVLAATSCYAEGKTRIFNASRLRLKESDRLSAITSELRKMGAKIEERQDELIINGSKLHGATIDPHNDHRIAMACAVAALGAEGETKIGNAECVSKSYPKFFEDLKKLGVDISMQ
ncbi:MAG: 3-phosphoshikimate 1-carboxyvinyltransferase [Candidatus Micrarchaeia archaeon]